jgi:predicted nucleic acid-binding protein
MTITDTQILSYYYKRDLPLPEAPIFISSITAAEFLLIQSTIPSRANYYPILPSKLGHFTGKFSQIQTLNSRMLFDSKKHAALGKHRTDQIILDFNGRIPSFIEFGSIAISQIINHRFDNIYTASISHLEKDLKRRLQKKLDFLLSMGTQCFPVTTNIAEIGMNLLDQFLDKYEPKQNPRNTINDILILATAIKYSAPLLTQDGLLKRFTAEILGAKYHEQHPETLMIDFTTPEVISHRKPIESKSYINRGWQITEYRGNK